MSPRLPIPTPQGNTRSGRFVESPIAGLVASIRIPASGHDRDETSHGAFSDRSLRSNSRRVASRHPGARSRRERARGGSGRSDAVRARNPGGRGPAGTAEGGRRSTKRSSPSAPTFGRDPQPRSRHRVVEEPRRDDVDHRGRRLVVLDGDPLVRADTRGDLIGEQLGIAGPERLVLGDVVVEPRCQSDARVEVDVDDARPAARSRSRRASGERRRRRSQRRPCRLVPTAGSRSSRRPAGSRRRRCRCRIRANRCRSRRSRSRRRHGSARTRCESAPPSSVAIVVGKSRGYCNTVGSVKRVNVASPSIRVRLLPASPRVRSNDGAVDSTTRRCGRPSG